MQVNNLDEQAPKVLVITMYCGEPQYERCVDSVKSQLRVNCTHHTIKDKSNVEAHRELYQLINSKKDKFNYFIKLDADMEFNGAFAVDELLGLFERETDHVTIPVFDFMINSDMPCLHVFSNRVTIDTEEMDELYVDNVKVSYPGVKKTLDSSRKLVFHCKNASMEQSIAFGVHRALKVCQYDRFIPNIWASRYHFETLYKLHINNKRLDGTDELTLAELYADKVLRGEIRENIRDKKKFFENGYGSKTALRNNVLFNKFNLYRVFRAVGFGKSFVGIFFWSVRKVQRFFRSNAKKSN